MAFCGFYLIFMESDSKHWWKHSMLTAFGLTGMIQSHILSCEMGVLFIIITCLILIRLVIKPHTFRALSVGAILTVLLNLGFLVPFLNYFNENIKVLSSEWTGGKDGNIQNMGMFPVQIFSLFQRSNGGTWSTDAGVYSESTFGIGIVLLMGMGVFIYLLLCHRPKCSDNRNFLPACLSFGLGCLALWMSTCYFPWNQIAQSGDLAKTLVNSLQFPWRMLAPATILLTFVTCFAFTQLRNVTEEITSTALIYSCIVLLAVNIGWYFYDFCFTGTPYRIYATNELDSMTMYSYDYLPTGTDPTQIKSGRILAGDTTFIHAYEKQGTQITCYATTEGSEGWIDFPLNYYQYYTCRVLETGESLEVSAGTNNMVRVSLPSNFSGNLDVHFEEPLHWRISEILSAITLLGCMVLLLKKFIHLPIGFRTNLYATIQNKRNTKK